MKRREIFAVLVLSLLMLLVLLGACSKASADDDGVTSGETPVTAEAPPQDDTNAITHVIELPPVVEVVAQEPENLVPWFGVVEHLFFHPIVTYPEMAFDGDYEEAGIDEYMVTLDEYNRILQSLYDNDYILVNWNDVWIEKLDENGTARMVTNTLMLPEGKKPIVLSFDDVNYYDYMLANGFTYKLFIGRDGEIWSYGKDPDGNDVVSQDLDAVTILDKFVEEHPDFSLNGVKGCLNLTGYQGILGYRTQTDKNTKPEDMEAFEANRQLEIAAVRPVVEKLKETGWYFASHTFAHFTFATASYSRATADAERWAEEVGSIIGPTQLLVYPYGSRPDGDDVRQVGEVFKYYQRLGFRVFASVGIESYSQIKTSISAVICDRMHADGGTLRRERNRYMKFYDAAEVWDDTRPDLGRSW